MSRHEYEQSRQLERDDVPFYTLIMAAMRRADDVNLPKLRSSWPHVWEELQARYHAPGGLLPNDGPS